MQPRGGHLCFDLVTARHNETLCERTESAHDCKTDKNSQKFESSSRNWTRLLIGLILARTSWLNAIYTTSPQCLASTATTPSTHSTRTGKAQQVLARHCGLVVYMAFSHEVLALILFSAALPPRLPQLRQKHEEMISLVKRCHMMCHVQIAKERTEDFQVTKRELFVCILM